MRGFAPLRGGRSAWRWSWRWRVTAPRRRSSRRLAYGARDPRQLGPAPGSDGVLRRGDVERRRLVAVARARPEPAGAPRKASGSDVSLAAFTAQQRPPESKLILRAPRASGWRARRVAP